MKAFPVTKFNSHRVGHDGMDLRDYFAAAALQGMSASAGADPGVENAISAKLAKAAYCRADAMLEARKARN